MHTDVRSTIAYTMFQLYCNHFSISVESTPTKNISGQNKPAHMHTLLIQSAIIQLFY